MGKPQTITTRAGETLIVLSLQEYESLLARAGDEAAEDAMTARLVDEAAAAKAAGREVALPAAVWESIEGGTNPIRALREHRGLTQAALADAAGVSQAYVAELEGGRKQGAPATLRRCAAALGVPVSLLLGG